MGRRRRSAAFSLFSFQDIITAVTAILILILLIMTLSLIQQKRVAGAADGAVSRRAVDELIEQLSQRSEDLEAQSEKAAEIEQERQSRSAIEQQISVNQNRLNEMRVKRNDTDKLLFAAEQLEKRVEREFEKRDDEFEALERSRKRLAELKEQAEALHEENDAERERQSAMKDAIEDRPIGDDLVFNAGDARSLQPWLVDVSSEGILGVALGENRQVNLGANASTLEFQKWLAERRAAEDHVLILVRPSGVGLLDGVESSLSEKSIAYGVDLVAEDVAVRDSAAEAASN
jgi:molybdopterin converting factor small subunit